MSINYNKAKFEASYGTVKQLPASTAPEIAFCGRSNVGKSSLMNKLVNRKGLVKVSSKPGKTSNVNFFDIKGAKLVDLPGYGFARVSKTEKERWSDLIWGYFKQERDHRLTVVLVDIRHDAQKLDVNMIEFLKEHELPFIIALTKADKISKGKRHNQKMHLSKQFDIPAEYFLITSSQDGTGMDELRKIIREVCDE